MAFPTPRELVSDIIKFETCNVRHATICETICPLYGKCRIITLPSQTKKLAEELMNEWRQADEKIKWLEGL